MKKYVIFKIRLNLPFYEEAEKIQRVEKYKKKKRPQIRDKVASSGGMQQSIGLLICCSINFS